jgi:hypothetical protein
MTAACALWPQLRERLADRLDRQAGGPVLASRELAHLDDCPGCRRAALALDPSLALRPLAEAAPPLDRRDSDDIEGMRLAVAALRRAGRPSRRSMAPWGRAAAALALLAGALYQLPLQRIAPPVAPVAELTSPALGLPAPGALPVDFAYEPVVENLDRPDARVYQLGGGDVSVVMIVDETLDV